jgi:hypothetical protein
LEISNFLLNNSFPFSCEDALVEYVCKVVSEKSDDISRIIWIHESDRDKVAATIGLLTLFNKVFMHNDGPWVVRLQKSDVQEGEKSRSCCKKFGERVKAASHGALCGDGLENGNNHPVLHTYGCSKEDFAPILNFGGAAVVWHEHLLGRDNNPLHGKVVPHTYFATPPSDEALTRLCCQDKTCKNILVFTPNRKTECLTFSAAFTAKGLEQIAKLDANVGDVADGANDADVADGANDADVADGANDADVADGANDADVAEYGTDEFQDNTGGLGVAPPSEPRGGNLCKQPLS